MDSFTSVGQTHYNIFPAKMASGRENVLSKPHASMLHAFCAYPVSDAFLDLKDDAPADSLTLLA